MGTKISVKRLAQKKRPGYVRRPIEHNKHKLTLKSDIVIEYAKWHAIPTKLRPAELCSEEKFLVANGYSAKSRNLLDIIGQIEGFWAMRDRYANDYKGYSVAIAIGGLHKRAEGLERKFQRVDADGNEHDLVEDVVPDPMAAKILLEAHGGLKSSEEKVADTLANAFMKVAGVNKK